MSGTTIGGPGGTGFNDIPVFNALVPKEGPKVIRVLVTFSQGTNFLVDMQQSQSLKRMSVVQSLFVDNWNGGAPVFITCSGSNQRVVIPAYSQRYIPVFGVNPAQFNFQSSSGVDTPVHFCNVPLPSSGWNNAGSSTVQSTSDAADGSITPGATGTKAILTGGLYTAGGITLTSGQMAALQVNAAGQLLVDDTPSQLTLTGFGTTLTTGGVAQQIAAANASRNAFIIQNPPDAASQGIAAAENLFVNVGAAAVLNSSVNYAVLAPGQSCSLEVTSGQVASGLVSVIAATTGHIILAKGA